MPYREFFHNRLCGVQNLLLTIYLCQNIVQIFPFVLPARPISFFWIELTVLGTKCTTRNITSYKAYTDATESILTWNHSNLGYLVPQKRLMAYCKTLKFNWSALQLHVARHSVVLNSLLLKQTDRVYAPPSVYEEECYTHFQRTLRCYCSYISVNFILLLEDPEIWLATKFINMYPLSSFFWIEPLRIFNPLKQGCTDPGYSYFWTLSKKLALFYTFGD
jgi:hypothetical protein